MTLYLLCLHCTQFIVLCTGDWWASALVELVNKWQRVWLQILIHTGASIIVCHHSILTVSLCLNRNYFFSNLPKTCFFFCLLDGLQVRNTHLFVREGKKRIVFGSLYLPVHLIHKHEREATRLSARHLDQRSSRQVSIMVSWNWLWGESRAWHHRKDLISTHIERKSAWLLVRPCGTARFFFCSCKSILYIHNAEVIWNNYSTVAHNESSSSKKSGFGERFWAGRDCVSLISLASHEFML